MGCSGSKPSADAVSANDVKPSIPSKTGSASKLDPVEVNNMRLSVNYQAKESGRQSASRRSSAPFDKAHIGTKTKHGIAPGPGGKVNAKINQDRGVVCWPFHGSLNEALLCVFDGHGPKGERVSEFCMSRLPPMLEADHDALVADPAVCLSKQIPILDKLLLNDPNVGRTAMNAGTTSNVLYMKGDTVWVACSGDSRAIKASRVNGKIKATDLSNDHKPDLPLERARIEKAGGEVSPAGPGGRPSRVWSGGRFGLAMSRSLGDGECKKVGVIPDPEVQSFKLSPAANANEDGDLFVIVASDGVWEFIESQEAAELVARSNHASDACDVIVAEAARRWRIEEGTYRDDITAIITFLPFLEDWGAEAPDESDELEHEIFLNRGAAGIAKLKARTPEAGTDAGAATGADPPPSYRGKADKEEDDIVKRRLSVVNMFDETSEWERAGEEEEDL